MAWHCLLTKSRKLDRQLSINLSSLYTYTHTHVPQDWCRLELNEVRLLKFYFSHKIVLGIYIVVQLTTLRGVQERERERERVLVGPFSLLCELFFFVSQWVLRLECWRKQQYWCSPVPKFENNTDIKQERSMCYQLNVHVVNHNVFLIMPQWAEPRGIR